MTLISTAAAIFGTSNEGTSIQFFDSNNQLIKENNSNIWFVEELSNVGRPDQPLQNAVKGESKAAWDLPEGMKFYIVFHRPRGIRFVDISYEGYPDEPVVGHLFTSGDVYKSPLFTVPKDLKNRSYSIKTILPITESSQNFVPSNLETPSIVEAVTPYQTSFSGSKSGDLATSLSIQSENFITSGVPTIHKEPTPAQTILSPAVPVVSSEVLEASLERAKEINENFNKQIQENKTLEIPKEKTIVEDERKKLIFGLLIVGLISAAATMFYITRKKSRKRNLDKARKISKEIDELIKEKK